MNEYAEAKELLDKLAPNIFVQMGTWFGGLGDAAQAAQAVQAAAAEPPKTPTPMQQNSWKLKE